MLCFSSMSTEAWFLLLIWNSACDRSFRETMHFLHLVQGNLREIHYSYLFHYLLHLTYVLIPNILAKNSSPFFFIWVNVVSVKTMSSVQSFLISFTKYLCQKENRVKKWNYIFWSIRWCHVRFHILYQIQKQLLTRIL